MADTYRNEEEKVSRACAAFLSGQFKSIAAAARSEGAKDRRVRNRLAGQNSRSTRPPTNRLLTENEELGLLKWIERLDKLGTRPSLKMIEREVNWLLSQRQEIPHKICGENWVRRFIERHEEIELRKEKPRDIERECMEDVDGLTKWYRDWELVCKQYGLYTTDIYNWDESPLRLGQGSTQTKAASTANPELHCGRNTSRETATIGEFICADGWAPAGCTIIFSGELFMETWADSPLHNGYWIETTPNGFITDETFFDWLVKVFNPATQRRQMGAWRCLVLDGHTTHVTEEILEFCDQEGIILFLTPPYLTHLTQPLDVGVFSTWKTKYSEAVD
jgi:hypothetical protein